MPSISEIQSYLTRNLKTEDDLLPLTVSVVEMRRILNAFDKMGDL